MSKPGYFSLHKSERTLHLLAVLAERWGFDLAARGAIPAIVNKALEAAVDYAIPVGDKTAEEAPHDDAAL